jgi:hypothetical protein
MGNVMRVTGGHDNDKRERWPGNRTMSAELKAAPPSLTEPPYSAIASLSNGN